MTETLKEQTITYIKEINGKKRKITTYKNNAKGRQLRRLHKIETENINNLYEQKKSQVVYSYRKGKNTQQMVRKHLNSKYYLKIDIHHFFESINREKLIKKLHEMNYYNDELVASCSIKGINEGIAIGLKPSATLANIYLLSFDQKLEKITNKLNLIYSRYSDDILISSEEQFSKEELLNIIEETLAIENLKLNKKKTQYKILDKPTDHFKILGLNIVKGQNNNYITVSRNYKNKVSREKNPNIKKGKERYIKFNDKIKNSTQY